MEGYILGKNIVYVDEDLKELIPGFLENRYEDITNLKTALHDKDFETLRKMGHSIKGVGGGYGFDYVTELGYNIEEAAKAEDVSNISKLIDELKDHLDKVEIKYE